MLSSFVRHGQAVLTRYFPHQANRRFIKANRPPVGAIGAQYNYTTSAAPPQNPGHGAMNQATGSLFVRFNRIDANGRDITAGFSQLRAGDSMTIGAQTGVFAIDPILNASQYWQVAFVAFPVLVNGSYFCTAKRAGT